MSPRRSLLLVSSLVIALWSGALRAEGGCDGTGAALVSSIVEGPEGAQLGDYVFQVTRGGKGAPTNLVRIATLGSDSRAPAAVKDAYAAQLNEVREFLRLILVEEMSGTESSNAPLALPFSQVTISQAGLIEYCKSFICNIAAGVSFNLYQPPGRRTLMLRFVGSKPIKAEELARIYLSRRHQGRMARVIEPLLKKRSDGYKALFDAFQARLEASAKSIAGLLKEARGKSEPVELKFRVIGVLEASINKGEGRADRLKETINRAEAAGKLIDLIERVVAKLENPGLAEKLISVAHRQREARRLEILTHVSYDQRNVLGVLVNVGGDTRVGVVTTETSVEDFIYVESKTPDQWQYRQTNVFGVTVNEFDKIDVQVDIRQGADLALALREAAAELGI